MRMTICGSMAVCLCLSIGYTIRMLCHFERVETEKKKKLGEIAMNQTYQQK
jgi:hypothetical protein